MRCLRFCWRHCVQRYVGRKVGKMLKILQKPRLMIYGNFSRSKMAFPTTIHTAVFLEPWTLSTFKCRVRTGSRAYGKSSRHSFDDDKKDQVVINVLNPKIQYDKGYGHWTSIQSIIRIDSVREYKMNTTTETRYYISSCQLTPKKILQAIRSHWAIENNLHWVLDMSFGEDMCRIRKNNAPQIMAVIRHIALNLLQLTKDKMKRQSIKRLRKMTGWDHALLSTIISQNFSWGDPDSP